MAHSYNKRSRKAADIFKSCPRCGSPNVLRVEGEALCSYCDWHSVDIEAFDSSRAIPVQMKADGEPARPSSLESLIDKILEENPFLSGDPVYA